MLKHLGPWRGFLILVGIILLLHFIFISVFVWSFDYSPVIVPLHLLVVFALISAITLFLALLASFRRFREWRRARIVVGLVPGVGAVLLAALAGLDYVSNYAWGCNVTGKVLIGYILPDWSSISTSLPIHTRWVYVAMLVFLGPVIVLYLALSGRFLRGLQEMFLPGRPFSLFRNRSRGTASGVALGATAVAFGVFLALTVPAPSNLWRGEPIVGLSRPYAILQNEMRNAEVSEQDRRARAAYPRGRAFEKTNVVLIMADSLRPDHMQVCGYERPTTPFLTDLAETGWLRKVAFMTSTCSETACGVLSTVASRSYVNLSDYNFKLHDLLHDQGYRVYFLLSGDHTLFYDQYKHVLGEGVDLFFDGVCSERYPVSDDRLVLEGLERVPDYDGTPACFFFFLMASHIVGVKLAPYGQYQPSKLGLSGMAAVWLGERNNQTLTNLYDNGVLQVDAFIEQIFEALRHKGYLDDCLAMVTADHGQGLGERGYYSHTVYLYQEDIGIPLLIYDEPEVRYANLEFATQKDVAPTIADRLGLPVPDCWEGVSLLSDAPHAYTFHTTRRNDVWRAVIWRTQGKLYKYLRWRKESPPARREALYELVSDPGERRNLLRKVDPALVRHLRAQMAAAFNVPAD